MYKGNQRKHVLSGLFFPRTWEGIDVDDSIMSSTFLHHNVDTEKVHFQRKAQHRYHTIKQFSTSGRTSITLFVVVKDTQQRDGIGFRYIMAVEKYSRSLCGKGTLIKLIGNN